MRDTRKIEWDSRGKEIFNQSSNFLTSWEVGVVCSNEPLKLLHQTKCPLLAFSLVQVVMAHHKEKYQQHKTIVQTYTLINPIVQKVNSTILPSGTSSFIIFHGSCNLNHNQHYHFHELKKLNIETQWKRKIFQSLDIELISMG